MDAIEVVAEFGAQGRVSPYSFEWNNRNYTITSTGRQWQAEDGYHILVMAAGEQVFHLVFSSSERRWYLIPTYGPQANPAV